MQVIYVPKYIPALVESIAFFLRPGGAHTALLTTYTHHVIRRYSESSG